MISVDYLENHPDFISVCAAWAFGQWGCQSGGSYERAVKRFSEGAQQTEIPLTLVAIEDNKPIGMISLWQQDHEERSDLSPWLASLFVHPFYRKKGVASLLITALEKEAKRLGFDKMHLVTEDSKGLYEKHGWFEMDVVKTAYGTASLMYKEL